METVDEQGFRRDGAKVWDDMEQSRRRELREDAGRSPAENLAEGLALSEFLSTFMGAAGRRSRFVPTSSDVAIARST
jgi:hypothetical protein